MSDPTPREPRQSRQSRQPAQRPAPDRPQQGAAAQVARLLTLVPLLHAHGQMPLAAAADVLGVSPQQLLRDLKVLFLVGLPGGYPDDLIDVDLDALEGPEGPNPSGMIRISNADYLARPLRLNPTEASAMIVALRAMRNGTGEETRAVVDRALAKLEQAAAAGPPSAALDPGPDPEGPERVALAGRLRAATEQQRQVRLAYYVPARDEVSDRVVDPRRVVSHGALTYLDAWCHTAEAPRLFRLDRIAEAEVLDSPVTSEPHEPRDLSAGLFAQSEDTTPVTLLLAPEATWVVEYYPVEAVRQQPDGGVEVDLDVADHRWLRRLLLRLSPHARVVAPDDLAADHDAAVRAALALYS